MAETLLIDGNNLIHQIPRLESIRQKSHQLAVEELIHRLEPLVVHAGYQVILVIDGSQLPEEESYLASPVRVIYSGKAQTADSVIERFVYKTHTPQELIVVTTDRALSQMVLGKGARVWSTSQFESLLLSPSL